MDERKRAFERAAAGGDADAKVQLLRERLRMGEITPRYLELAAFLGDGESADVLGLSTRPDEPRSVDDLEVWVQKLERKIFRCPESFYIDMRVAVAVAEFVATTYINSVRRLELGSVDPLYPDELLALVSRPPKPPSTPIQNELLRAKRIRELSRGDDFVDSAAFVYEALCDELLVVSNPEAMIEPMIMVVPEHIQLLAEQEGKTVDSVAVVYQAIRSDLIPWLKGEGDPAQQRRESRQREREAKQRLNDARGTLENLP